MSIIENVSEGVGEVDGRGRSGKMGKQAREVHISERTSL